MSKTKFTSNSLKPFINFDGLKGDEVVERKGLQSKLTIGEEEERTIICNITTDSIDADGDIIIGNGADLNRYLKNPVVLVNHSHKVEDVIGRATELSVSKNGIMAKIVLATTQKASDVWELVKGKFLNTNSIGFIIKSAIVRGTKDYANYISQNPQYSVANRIITSFELLENSLVAIPSNPDALVVAYSTKAIQLSDNMAKELKLVEVSEKVPTISDKEEPKVEEVKEVVIEVEEVMKEEPKVEVKIEEVVKEPKVEEVKEVFRFIKVLRLGFNPEDIAKEQLKEEQTIIKMLKKGKVL